MNLTRAGSTRPVMCLFLLVAAYLVVGYATLTPGHIWGDDWAQYLGHARNLATGHPYADTGYVFNPAMPHVGPPAYSPGLPVLLAPIVRIFGINLIALKLMSLLALAAATVLTFVLYKDYLGAWVALAAAAFFSLHDAVWFMHNAVQSEPTYILCSLAALIFAARPLHGRGVATGLACGLFSYGAFAIRPIGAAVILATALYEVLQRRLVSWRFLCIIGVPVIGYVLQKHFLAIADYSSEFRVLTIRVLAADAFEYWKQASTLFPLGSSLSLLTPVLLLCLAALGIAYRVRLALRWLPGQSARAQGASLLQAIPVDIWYLVIYCGTLVALPFVQEARYLLPVFPIVFAYSAYGLSRALSATRYARPAIAAACSLVLIYYAALHWKHDRPVPGDEALCVDCRAMYDYFDSHTPQDTTVAFAKPRAFALLTGRRGWMWSPDLSQHDNWQAMTQAHVGYIVLVAPDSPLAERYPPYFGWEAWRSNPLVTLVYQNDGFRVLRVQPAGG